MPGSRDDLDHIFTGLLTAAKPKTLLDCGAGRGKYGMRTRDLLPGCARFAIEVDREYVLLYDLRDIYETVWTVDLADLAAVRAALGSRTFDLVVLGDVLEHLPKTAGINLVHFLAYRCKRLFAVWPVGWVQTVPDKPQEEHISAWGFQDFLPFATRTFTTRGKRPKLAVILEGMLDHAPLPAEGTHDATAAS